MVTESKVEDRDDRTETFKRLHDRWSPGGILRQDQQLQCSHNQVTSGPTDFVSFDETTVQV